MRHSRRAGLLVAIVSLAPATAQANAGIGFFTPAAMTILLAIVPVVLVEWAILRWRLPVATGRAFKLSLVANVISTVAGAVIGVALDFALVGASGSSGLWGPIGFTISLVLMFVISWWIEKRTVAGMSPAIPIPAVAGAVLVANLVTYAMLVVAVFVLVPHEEPYRDRSRLTEIINAMGVERLEVTEHHAKTGSFPPARTQEKPTANTKRLVREADGRIIGYIGLKKPELDGKTIVYEPQLREGKPLGWKCFTAEVPLKIMPSTCRYRSAAEAAVFE